MSPQRRAAHLAEVRAQGTSARIGRGNLCGRKGEAGDQLRGGQHPVPKRLRSSRHGILLVNGMHAKLIVWFALALVLARVQCVGVCAERSSTGDPPCHRHSDSRNERPAPCSHCIVARPSPSPALQLAAPALSSGSVDVPWWTIFSCISRERMRNLPASSPPGLISLSSVLLRL